MEILLSKIMHERNLTVRQVEQMTKVPKSTINDIMNGKSVQISVRVLGQIQKSRYFSRLGLLL